MCAFKPSRTVLRHLSRVLESPRPSTPQAPSRRTLCTRLAPSTTRRPTPLHTITPSSNSQPSRSISSTSALSIQPSASAETDPQNAAANTPLPDITNFYTLFPSTLPSGPPGPAAKEQSPVSTPSASFTIHHPTLRKEFLHLQSLHHPDKYPTGSVAHQKALALSSYINNAYKTLGDSLLRAQYLLQLLYDVDVTSEDNAAHPTDQGTLMEVMEAQERVEEAKTQDDVDEIKEENERRMVETERVMAEAFERGSVNEAKEECVKLKYWRSLQSALNEWEPGKEVRLIH